MYALTVSFGSKEAGTGAPIQSNSSDVWAAITLDGTGLQVSFESSGKTILFPAAMPTTPPCWLPTLGRTPMCLPSRQAASSRL